MKENEGMQQERGQTPRAANVPLRPEFRTGWQRLGDSGEGGVREGKGCPGHRWSGQHGSETYRPVEL